MNATQAMPLTDTSSAAPWWKGAAIYQIYPRSFADSNGDGIGDLPGITAHLDYVAELGADAIWLSPFFTSPMADFGYDVADYCGVDPIFGTIEDFDALVARAHELGLKVLIDQVYSHCSDQNPWFLESRSSRDNAKADWFVWADAKPDGSPPTNWQSVFGGPAWTWDARRGQYYMHNFLKDQPQLNIHNPEVQEALLGVARFWLDRGVDGFRMDAINFAMHDPEFRDNPPAPPSPRPRTRPFDFQLKQFNQSHEDIPGFIERLRALTDSYGARFTVAEVGGDDADREMKLFTEGEKRLNSAYGFDFLYADRLTPRTVADALSRWPEQPGMGWPSWAFENHDAPRALSRWATPEQADRFARLKMLLLTALRGNIFLYYGEELGLTQVDIPYEKLQDPEALANWPMTLSRDGARTPMPWQHDAANCGFGSAEPWLPIGPDHPGRAVDVQRADPGSLFHLTQRLLRLRRETPALRYGAMEIVRADENVLAIDRMADGRRVRCLFNFGTAAMSVPSELDVSGTVLASVGDADAAQLPPLSGVYVELRSSE